MVRPSSQLKPTRSWHRRIEQYTPDGLLGRLVFAGAMGPIITFFVWLAGLGILSSGLSSLLLLLFATVAGVGVTLLGLVVLWPVYLSLIGNIESPEAYSNGDSTGTLDVTDSDDSVAELKQQYAAGEMGDEEFERRQNQLSILIHGGDEEFERRLDTLLGVEERISSNPSPNVDPTSPEYERN